MGNRILVTGGAGYIGSVLVPELLASGHQVTVVDSFLYRENSLAAVAYHEKFSVVNGDVRDEKLMEKLIAAADIIIPLAALVGAPLCQKDPVAATSTNRDSLLSLFKKIGREQWILMPTTNSAYGTSEGGNYLTETSPLNPISRYAQDKVTVEKGLMELRNSVSFRLATVFGMSPRMRTDLLVNDFTYRAVYDRFVVLFEGHFKRNYIHIRDVVRAFLWAISNFEKVRGQVFNVGLSDANLTKLELCRVIQRQIPQFVFMEAPVGEDPDKRDYLISNDKIERAGFRAQFSLESGIRELVKGFTMIKNSRYSNV